MDLTPWIFTQSRTCRTIRWIDTRTHKALYNVTPGVNKPRGRGLGPRFLLFIYRLLLIVFAFPPSGHSHLWTSTTIFFLFLQSFSIRILHARFIFFLRDCTETADIASCLVTRKLFSPERTHLEDLTAITISPNLSPPSCRSVFLPLLIMLRDNARNHRESFRSTRTMKKRRRKCSVIHCNYEQHKNYILTPNDPSFFNVTSHFEIFF